MKSLTPTQQLEIEKLAKVHRTVTAMIEVIYENDLGYDDMLEVLCDMARRRIKNQQSESSPVRGIGGKTQNVMNHRINKKARTITFTNIMNESQLEHVTMTAENVGCPYEVSDYSTKVVVRANYALTDGEKDAQLNKFIKAYNA